MNLFDKIKWMFYKMKSSIQERKYRRKYPDYKGESMYDCGVYKFIWGVKSQTELCSEPASLHTINDIDIIYSRETGRYILDINTSYWFDKPIDTKRYLSSLLDEFTKYMNENGLLTTEQYKFWMSTPCILFEGETIQELYTSFRIFTEGYKVTHKRRKNI